MGTSAIQLVKQFQNTKVLVTAGSEEKIEFCKKLGASAGFNRKDGPWYTTRITPSVEWS